MSTVTSRLLTGAGLLPIKVPAIAGTGVLKLRVQSYTYLNANDVQVDIRPANYRDENDNILVNNAKHSGSPTAHDVLIDYYFAVNNGKCPSAAIEEPDGTWTLMLCVVQCVAENKFTITYLATYTEAPALRDINASFIYTSSLTANTNLTQTKNESFFGIPHVNNRIGSVVAYISGINTTSSQDAPMLGVLNPNGYTLQAPDSRSKVLCQSFDGSVCFYNKAIEPGTTTNPTGLDGLSQVCVFVFNDGKINYTGHYQRGTGVDLLIRLSLEAPVPGYSRDSATAFVYVRGLGKFVP